MSASDTVLVPLRVVEEILEEIGSLIASLSAGNDRQCPPDEFRCTAITQSGRRCIRLGYFVLDNAAPWDHRRAGPGEKGICSQHSRIQRGCARRRQAVGARNDNVIAFPGGAS